MVKFVQIDINSWKTIIVIEWYNKLFLLTCLETFPSLFLSMFLKSFSMADSSPRNSSNDKWPSKSLSLERKKSSTSCLKHVGERIERNIMLFCFQKNTLRLELLRHWGPYTIHPGLFCHPCFCQHGQNISGSKNALWQNLSFMWIQVLKFLSIWKEFSWFVFFTNSKLN